MTATLTATPTRADILDALRAFICQRPGLEPGNYGNYADYRTEADRITRDRADALALLNAVAWRESITAEAMLVELHHRLTWDHERGTLDYCTGQYFPVEYRRAAASALSAMLWSYWRDLCGCDTADKIRAEARRSFRSRRLLAYFR